jgi:hypothetical protein
MRMTEDLELDADVMEYFRRVADAAVIDVKSTRPTGPSP